MIEDESMRCVGCSQQVKPIVKSCAAALLVVKCPVCGFRDEIPQGGHA